MPIKKQCELLNISRSGLYYEPAGESDYNLKLMKMIDEEYTKRPFYGVPKMTEWLKSKGYLVGPKRIRRLMRKMGLMAIYPKPKTSLRQPEHRIYPYLLKDVDIIRPNQVWCSDITYIRMRKGFIYLTAVMDWFSRYVLSWNISISMESGLCTEALQSALALSQPEIFNSDQGSQYTCTAFTRILQDCGIRISMDGRGRVFDNIFIERLWRSLKYEEVYIKDYESVPEAVRSISDYFDFYNHERLHQALDYKTPSQIYSGDFLARI